MAMPVLSQLPLAPKNPAVTSRPEPSASAPVAVRSRRRAAPVSAVAVPWPNSGVCISLKRRRHLRCCAHVVSSRLSECLSTHLTGARLNESAAAAAAAAAATIGTTAASAAVISQSVVGPKSNEPGAATTATATAAAVAAEGWLDPIAGSGIRFEVGEMRSAAHMSVWTPPATALAARLCCSAPPLFVSSLSPGLCAAATVAEPSM
eukprot:CAMPEP_0119525782 /NCGR_PEP_ID=MMETSP1344-20130328/40506_1 /TAXON_ID=236787 /ORGANISM="Florenciella parvula, Strain CCMP2471" /LENGTH=205 /DNA_ID=CAMNT_0007564627 /DNA_START=202 /DNA_END=821 /DNA_ORIENTATION=-